MATLAFYAFAIALLLVMAYWLWSGVGARRPTIGRGFAAAALALAAYLGWSILRIIT